jgi:hypothetical protein
MNRNQASNNSKNLQSDEEMVLSRFHLLFVHRGAVVAICCCCCDGCMLLASELTDSWILLLSLSTIVALFCC